MATDLSWELYRTFLAVSREGSLSGAARRLGITQPTVGRHVDQLEVAFGQRLFTRTQTGLKPTDAALVLHGHAEAMERVAAALERAGTGYREGEVSGTVRVSASEVVSMEVLPPAIAELRKHYPALRIEMVATNAVQDLLQREVDIAVRMAPPKQDVLVARHVGSVDIGLFAHEDYLARAGTPMRDDDLADHALIGYDHETPFLREASKAWPRWRREAFAFRSDSDLVQMALIRAGAGIGGCQVALARRDARLKRVLPHIGFPLETWIAMHGDLRTSRRHKVVFDALAACLQAHARPVPQA
ncbi:LysR family transcriptional regulator [Luteibacter aegosomaticola]|uniref:LysR family transcriptional regulator n=1 Tax=Luteibacter aegosomaticola TaxID=2911538 RepID=UPI001FF7671C|nr:LysR family transcriptional regulator [Luteibacter aegosomaticola]UPG90705.1 LysR family transcriptional regulator [Luteibacter aegosomaticola]